MASASVVSSGEVLTNSKGTTIQLTATLLDTIAIGILAVLVRVPFFGVAMHVDEGGYAYTAYWWSQGQRLYEQLWFDRPQGIFVVYRFILAFIGHETIHIRIAVALAGAMAGCLVYLIGKRLFDKQVALLAGLLFAVFSGCPQIEGFTGNAEVFMIVPAMIGVYLFLLGREANRGIWFFGAGFAVAIAILIKPSEVATLIFLIALTLAWINTNQRRVFLLVTLGFAVGIAPSVIHGYLTGWHEYIFCILGYRLLKDSVATRSIILHAKGIYNGITVVLVPALGFPFIFSCWTIIQKYRGRDLKSILVPLLWLGTSIIGIALGGNWYWHYFLQIVAPLSVISAYGIIHIFRNLPPISRPRFVAFNIVTLTISIGISFSILLVRDQHVLSFKLFHTEQSKNCADIANYLKTQTKPEDKVFIMYMGPEILYMSGRQSAFAHLYDKEYDRVPNIGDQLERALTNPATRPRYIVDLHEYQDHGELQRNTLEILRRDYVLDRVLGASVVYRRKG